MKKEKGQVGPPALSNSGGRLMKQHSLCFLRIVRTAWHVLLCPFLLLAFSGCPYGYRPAVWELEACVQPSDSVGPILISPEGISRYELNGTFDAYTFVADPPANKVRVLGPDFQLLYSIGDDTGVAKLLQPHAVAVARTREVGGHGMDSSASVYVADTRNHRICRFDHGGGFVLSWGSFGDSLGQFNTPRGIETDLRGRVYVLDSGNCRIQVFDSTGKLIRWWGSCGGGTGEFVGPIDLVVGYGYNFEAAWVAIADAGSNSVLFFDTVGNFLKADRQLYELTGIGEGSSSHPYHAAAVSRRKLIYFCYYDKAGTGGVSSVPISEMVDPVDFGLEAVIDRAGRKVCTYTYNVH